MRRSSVTKVREYANLKSVKNHTVDIRPRYFFYNQIKYFVNKEHLCWIPPKIDFVWFKRTDCFTGLVQP